MRHRPLNLLPFSSALSLLGALVFSCSSSDHHAASVELGGEGGGLAAAGMSGSRATESVGGSDGQGGLPGTAGATEPSAGAGAGGEASSPLPADVQAFCDAAADYICRWDVHCNGVAACTVDHGTLLQTFCAQRLPGLLETGYIEFDAELAKTCIPDEPYCSQRPPDFLDNGPCVGVFRGTVDPGEACGRLSVSNWMLPRSICRDGYCVEEDTCPGTCHLFAELDAACDQETPCDQRRATCVAGVCVPRPALGEHCDDSVQCRGDGYCAGSGQAKVCRVYSTLGDACDDVQRCGFRFACKNGKCSAQVGAGDVCTRAAQCPDGDGCFQVSANAENTCQPFLKLGAPCPLQGCNAGLGQECQYVNDVQRCVQAGGQDDSCEPYGCRDDYWCRYDAQHPEGTCQPPGGPGDACATTAGPRSRDAYSCSWAEGSYYCAAGKCRAAGGLGSPCDPDLNACTEGWCSYQTGHCEEPAPLDAACNVYNDHACADGLYCDCPGDCLQGTDAGTCSQKKPNGALCDIANECESASCDVLQDPPRCGAGPSSCEPFY